MTGQRKPNDKPAAIRTTVGFELNELAIRLVEAMAKEHGEEPEAILREMQKGTPIARMMLRLLGIQIPVIRRGRRPDAQQVKAVHAVVQELQRRTGTRAEAIKRTPAELVKRGITPRPITEHSVRQALGKTAMIWFDEAAVPAEADEE